MSILLGPKRKLRERTDDGGVFSHEFERRIQLTDNDPHTDPHTYAAPSVGDTELHEQMHRFEAAVDVADALVDDFNAEEAQGDKLFKELLLHAPEAVAARYIAAAAPDRLRRVVPNMAEFFINNMHRLVVVGALVAAVEDSGWLDDTTDQGQTMLFLACGNDIRKLALLLVQKGALLDQVITDGNNALILACYSNMKEVALLMVQKGALLDQVNNDGDNALINACRNGWKDVALLMVQKGALLDQVNDDGDNALIMACRIGLADVALLMVQKGALLDQVNK